MPRAGMVGALPWPAWAAVAGMLSSPEDEPHKAWRATVVEMRRTCKALAEVVAAGCVGGAGWQRVRTAEKAAELEAAATAGLGRAVVIMVWLDLPELEVLEALARALAVAVERGHMITFGTSTRECTPAAARMIEAALIQASGEGQLLEANFDEGESLGWSVDAMTQLSSVELSYPERETVATLVGAGALQRVCLWDAEWADMSILSSLREVKLQDCVFEDLSPLADVPWLLVSRCDGIKALPAMRNDVLEVSACHSLAILSGLAGGRVGRLDLRLLRSVEDVSAIGAMQPPPRTVMLRWMSKVKDLSMLAGVCRLEVIDCPMLDKDATLAALEGKVEAVRWR